MKALCWHGKEDVRVDTVDDPVLQDPHDAIIRVTATAHSQHSETIYPRQKSDCHVALLPQ